MPLGEILPRIIALARQAGQAVMAIYEGGDFKTVSKTDGSPLTAADLAADAIIASGLKVFGYPILSEEAVRQIGGAERFWLVDPVDGTQEFINRSGEFTINIGLIERNEPVLGVVYAPALGLLYYGAKGQGAYKQADANDPMPITAKSGSKVLKVAVSRSHLNAETNDYLQSLGPHKLLRVGSSLKLCYVAEGKIDLYPRLGPQYLWDTAAADAIVRAAGGNVTDLNDKPLTYNPEHLLNPSFIAAAKEVLY